MEHRRRNPAIITDIKIQNGNINITYPKVDGLKHKSVAKKINTIIRNEVYRLLKYQGYEQDKTKEFLGGYEVKLNLRGTLSIILENYAYEKDKSSGKTIRKVINIGLKDARIYRLGDLLNRKKRYISTIDEEIKMQIIKRNIPLTKEFHTVGKDPQFYLTEEALVVYFDINEYTSPDYKFLEFEIPYVQIEDIVSNKGPIIKLLSMLEMRQEDDKRK